MNLSDTVGGLDIPTVPRNKIKNPLTSNGLGVFDF